MYATKTLKKKVGRPRKEIDTGLLFHLIKNKCSVAAAAKFLGIHRDTIYSRHRSTIEEGRAANQRAWAIIADKMHEAFLEKLRRKEAAKPKKRRYCFRW